MRGLQGAGSRAGEMVRRGSRAGGMAAGQVPALIVGAGPAGLTAAITLARQGVQVLLVERRRDLSALPRATSISVRSMELLRSWGLEEEVRAGGVEVEWLAWVCETLSGASTGVAMPTGYPTAEQSALISPTAPACVPQDHLEPVLLDHLRSFAGVRVELGAEVVGIDPVNRDSRPDGVRAVLRDVDTGVSRVVDARYLLAADGAHSRVRNALGIPMHGTDHGVEAATALFRAPLWDLLGECRYGIYPVTHPEASGVFLPAGRGDRWLYFRQWEAGQQQLANLDDEAIGRLIKLGVGIANMTLRIERTRIGAFSFAAQLAKRFRQGNAFLIGDAAHRVTPRGGTGMNTAMQSAYDLGWKLAWVLRGWAKVELLDSYDVERRPVAEHNVARSDDPKGSFRSAEQELHVDLGGRLPHVWVPDPRVPAAIGRVCTLDLLGPGLTLYTGPESAPWAAAAARVCARVPIGVRSLDVISARALGIGRDGALLTRPDGSPAGSWRHGHDAVPGLEAALTSALVGCHTMVEPAPAVHHRALIGNVA